MNRCYSLQGYRYLVGYYPTSGVLTHDPPQGIYPTRYRIRPPSKAHAIPPHGHPSHYVDTPRKAARSLVERFSSA